MSAKKGQGSLFAPSGQQVVWTPELLDEITRCVLAECSVSETARRVGVADYSVARGAMIALHRVLTGGLGDYRWERGS